MENGKRDSSVHVANNASDDCHPIDVLAEESSIAVAAEKRTVAAFAAAHPHWQSELEAILPTILLCAILSAPASAPKRLPWR